VAISYAPLFATLHEKKINRQTLQTSLKMSSSTIAKLGKDEYVSLKVLDDICSFLGCDFQDVIKHIKEKK